MQTTRSLGTGTVYAHLGMIAHPDIESAKWRLWHGRWKGCLLKLAEVCRWTEARSFREVAGIRTLRRHLRGLFAYLEANQCGLVNYGARHWRGEPISTAFVESAINEIVARRMIKKQQMRWNRWTVQPFLDVRVAVLNGTLEGSFRRLYPQFRPANDTNPIADAA